MCYTAKIVRNTDILESLPECERLVHFENTPVKLLGGFNLLVADGHRRLYLANLDKDMLVLKQGKMPLAEADTSGLKPISPEHALKWFSNAWRKMQDRMDDADITALDTFLSILAKYL